MGEGEGERERRSDVRRGRTMGADLGHTLRYGLPSKVLKGVGWGGKEGKLWTVAGAGKGRQAVDGGGGNAYFDNVRPSSSRRCEGRKLRWCGQPAARRSLHGLSPGQARGVCGWLRLAIAAASRRIQGVAGDGAETGGGRGHAAGGLGFPPLARAALAAGVSVYRREGRIHLRPHPAVLHHHHSPALSVARHHTAKAHLRPAADRRCPRCPKAAERAGLCRHNRRSPRHRPQRIGTCGNRCAF
eukprot:scaffold2129_cov107-Isochrysis_galbana.AAC.9